MKALIERVGPCRLTPKPEDAFEALLEAIVHQQLRTSVAVKIHGRVTSLFGKKGATPEGLLRLSAARLRAAGLSRNKLAAMRDLAAKCRAGAVPPRRELEKLSDAEIVARLVAVRGVGVWTAQMFLIFRLGRPDVMPSADFGVRKAFGLLYRKNGRLPPPSAVDRHARRWAPHRTVASWYLWRSLDPA
jgi:3-methyladenine DNA glycosylase/8-oxoguanine DNA glycosylase